MSMCREQEMSPERKRRDNMQGCSGTFASSDGRVRNSREFRYEV